MDKIGLAVIGSGYWGGNWVRTFNERPDSRVVVVCDQSQDRLDEIGKRFPQVELTTRIEEAVGREDVQAAVVCTPAATHYDVAFRCLAAGKHVLIEKPMTTVSADAERLITLAAAKGLTLMVGHTFLYNSGIRTVKHYIESGEAGQLYYLYARRTNMGPIRRDVSAMWDLAPHDVAIFNYLLDATPEWVSAVGARVLATSKEDVGFVSLGYPGSIVGHIHVSWAEPNKVRELVVVGREKRLTFDDLNLTEPVRVFDKGVSPAAPGLNGRSDLEFAMHDGSILSPKIEAVEPLKAESSHFLSCIANRTCSISCGAEGIDVVRVMEAIDLSLARNGAPVEVGMRVLPNAFENRLHNVTPDVIRTLAVRSMEHQMEHNGIAHNGTDHDGTAAIVEKEDR